MISSKHSDPPSKRCLIRWLELPGHRPKPSSYLWHQVLKRVVMTLLIRSSATVWQKQAWEKCGRKVPDSSRKNIRKVRSSVTLSARLMKYTNPITQRPSWLSKTSLIALSSSLESHLSSWTLLISLWVAIWSELLRHIFIRNTTLIGLMPVTTTILLN